METKRMTFLENSGLCCAALDFVHSHRRACRGGMSMKPNRIPIFLLVSLATFLVAATSKASAVGHGHRERQDRLR